MKIGELSKERLKDLHWSFYFPDAMEHPEEFREIGLDPQMINEIQRKLISSSLEILRDKTDEGELISQCICILGQCKIKDRELHDSILDCLMDYINREFAFANEAVQSLYRLMDVVSKEAWESRIPHLVNLLERGNETTSWNGLYALVTLAPKMDKRLLQTQIDKILNVAKSNNDFRKTHAVSALGKLYQYADLKNEILNMILLAARDLDENSRRAAVFALKDCISDRTKDKILDLFESLLEDKAGIVKYGALEALTEVLPYKISNKAFYKILGFLKADEPWVRWRVVLALNKAYAELDASAKEKTVSLLRELIQDEDVFVKVRAYETLLNIKELEKRHYSEVDEALRMESDFVRHWVFLHFDGELV